MYSQFTSIVRSSVIVIQQRKEFADKSTSGTTFMFPSDQMSKDDPFRPITGLATTRVVQGKFLTPVALDLHRGCELNV